MTQIDTDKLLNKYLEDLRKKGPLALMSVTVFEGGDPLRPHTGTMTGELSPAHTCAVVGHQIKALRRFIFNMMNSEEAGEAMWATIMRYVAINTGHLVYRTIQIDSPTDPTSPV